MRCCCSAISPPAQTFPHRRLRSPPCSCTLISRGQLIPHPPPTLAPLAEPDGQSRARAACPAAGQYASIRSICCCAAAIAARLAAHSTNEEQSRDTGHGTVRIPWSKRFRGNSAALFTVGPEGKHGQGESVSLTRWHAGPATLTAPPRRAPSVCARLAAGWRTRAGGGSAVLWAASSRLSRRAHRILPRARERAPGPGSPVRRPVGGAAARDGCGVRRRGVQPRSLCGRGRVCGGGGGGGAA